MRNLLNFLTRYNNLIVFLVLEGIALYIISTGNSYQNSRLLNAVKGVTRGIEQKIYNTGSYLSLREINERLAMENFALKNRMEQMVRKENPVFFSVLDSVYKQEYQHTSGEVIDNSINRQKNFFTINKGELQGIKVDMAVRSEERRVGKECRSRWSP